MERQPEMLLSTLREYVRAIGGQLEVRAKFKNRKIVLSHLGAGRSRKPKRRLR